MAKLKVDDFGILENVQMWKHERLARFIESEHGVKIDPVVVALVIAVRPEWRNSDDYTDLISERRSGVEKERQKVRKVSTKSKSVDIEEEEIEPEPKAKTKKAKGKSTVKKAKAKVEPEVEESPKPKAKKSKVKKAKSKKERATASEETVFDE